MTEKYFCQAVAVLAAGCLLALTVQIIQEGQLDNRTVTALERPEYGAGSTSWEMEYTWENGEGLRQQEKMMVQVEEQKYSPEEKERLLDEAVKMVEQEYLGGKQLGRESGVSSESDGTGRGHSGGGFLE